MCVIQCVKCVYIDWLPFQAVWLPCPSATPAPVFQDSLKQAPYVRTCRPSRIEQDSETTKFLVTSVTRGRARGSFLAPPLLPAVGLNWWLWSSALLDPVLLYLTAFLLISWFNSNYTSNSEYFVSGFGLAAVGLGGRHLHWLNQ